MGGKKDLFISGAAAVTVHGAEVHGAVLKEHSTSLFLH